MRAGYIIAFAIALFMLVLMFRAATYVECREHGYSITACIVQAG